MTSIPVLFSAPLFGQIAQPTLCELFRFLSWHTGFVLDQADACKLTFGEESLTDVNLLSLCAARVPGIKIRAYTKHQERDNGADWEWWFCRGNQRGLCLRVQAKKLNNKTLAFEGLWQKSGSSYQIDKLINSAKQAVSFPLYCLYCGRFGGKVTQPGCLIASAHSLRRFENQKAALSVIQHLMRPWEVLVCPCNVDPGHPTGDLLSIVYGALESLAEAEVDSQGRRIGFFPGVTSEGIPLPERVRRVLSNEEPGKDSEPALAGMIIFQDGLPG